MDEESYVDTGGRCAPRGGLGCYSTDSGCAEEVGGSDEVVGMPLSARWSASRAMIEPWN
jgi:hypothetical protein